MCPVFPKFVVWSTGACVLSRLMSAPKLTRGAFRLRQALTGPESVLNKEDDGSARMIGRLNRIIIDFVNTLWQRRLLRAQEERGALGLPACVGSGRRNPETTLTAGLPLYSDEAEALLAYAQAATGNAANSLGITTHPALAVLAKECLQVRDLPFHHPVATRRGAADVHLLFLQELAASSDKSVEGLEGAVTSAALKKLASVSWKGCTPRPVDQITDAFFHIDAGRVQHLLYRLPSGAR